MWVPERVRFDPAWPALGALIYHTLGDFEKMRAV
jgi:hypothetical protein